MKAIKRISPNLELNSIVIAGQLPRYYVIHCDPCGYKKKKWHILQKQTCG